MRRLAAGTLLVGLAACAPLPADLPARPALSTPSADATLANLAAPLPHTAADARPAPWWRAFGAPELDRLIDTALRDQPDLAAAQARLAAAGQAERLAALDAGAHYATDVSLSRQRLSENGLYPPPIGGSTYTETQISQGVAYNLDWWGRNRALLRAAGNERRAAGSELAAARLSVAAAVADTYFGLADVDTRLRLARDLEACHVRERDLLQARHDLGLDAALPLIDARRKLDYDADLVHRLDYLGHAWRYRLSALLGSDPDHAGALPIPHANPAPPALPASLPVAWLARRPDVAALRSRVEAAAEQSTAAKAEFYPNLDLRLMVGLDTLELGKLLRAGSLTAAAGPALHLPIFNTATLRARLGLREADYAGAVAAYNHAVQEAARQGADAYALIASLERRAAAQDQAMQEAVRTRTLVGQRRDAGLAGPLDALEADAAVLGERLNDSEIQAARLRARVALYQALGGDLEDATP
ncbi:efflux transporter outer membrane subunit [Parasulfuritortus cantonensis]|uniref:efflux transporter outer membrane subunit n=1 Tax=Parasulfuritortus cantonensis TaxID=2528202 RepID=UPI0014052FB3|nr:efflux transporter outer membrane subunit [Parasulfuritortus cantonensis]